MYGVMLSIPKGRKLGLGGVAAAGLAASCLDPLFFTRTASLLSLLGAAAVVYWGDSKWSSVKISLTLLPASLLFFHSISLLSAFFYCATCTSVHVVVRTWHFVCDYATKTTKLLS